MSGPRVGWWDGPANAIDRLIFAGEDATEISWRLGLPRWMVAERFAVLAHQGALVARGEAA
jgi:hypothetical protein